MRVVRIGLSAAVLSLCWSLFAGETTQAQTPAPSAPPASTPRAAPPPPKPASGFVSPYEIVRTVRSAGFQPLSRPLREGASYVLRATDFRGIPMRVVLDARTGVIRDATRIVPASAGPYGMPPYGPPPYPYASPYGPPSYAYSGYAPPPYGEPDGYAVPPPAVASPVLNRMPSPAAAPTATHPAVSARPTPPLPRPRPAELTAKATDQPQPNGPVTKPVTAGNSGPPQTSSGAGAATAAPAAAAPAPAAAPHQASPGELIEN
jgi:hypothetical protein